MFKPVTLLNDELACLIVHRSNGGMGLDEMSVHLQSFGLDQICRHQSGEH